jgi:hypothetical protein
MSLEGTALMHRSKSKQGKDRKVADDTGTGNDRVGSCAVQSSTSCYLCGMLVTDINIHWRLNHRRVRIKPGTPKSQLGFAIGATETHHEVVGGKGNRRSKKRDSRGLAQPVVVCSEPDPLEMYPDELDETVNPWNDPDPLDGSARVKFRLDALAPAAQKSVAKSTSFLQLLSKYLIYRN